ncbi:MAG: DNA polymerase III subunit delta' [Gammaproteobacteria bacterium]|nr:DNA polymerase III subunit delta' [Gammaproteobacteria bacterium]
MRSLLFWLMNLNELIAEPLPWHDALWQQVVQTRQRQRLPHALLLSGPPGMGKSRFARRLANVLLCLRAAEKPCGECKSCHLLRAGYHPDLCEIHPEESGKMIKIEQIRKLIDFYALTANYNRYQVAILEPAEAMNINAANSLLKLLEEPPGESLILLVSHQTSRLPATVRSRCQRLNFSSPDSAAAHAWLAANKLGQEMDADLLLKLSAQAPLAALAMAEAMPGRQSLFESLKKLLKKKEDPVNIAAEWLTLGAKEVFYWMISWTMDLIRCNAGEQFIVNKDMANTLYRLSRQFDLRDLFELLDLQMESYRLLTSASNVKELGLLESVALAWTGASARMRKT